MGYADRFPGERPPSRDDSGQLYAIAFRIFAAMTTAFTLFNLYVEIFAVRPLPASGWEHTAAGVLEAVGRFVLIPMSANLGFTPDEPVSRWVGGLSPFLMAMLFGLIGLTRRNRDRF